MKMSQGMQAELVAALFGVLKANPDVRAKYAEAGLSPERFRWDVLWASKWDTRRAYDAGLSDSHIDTVLRSILQTQGTA